MNPLIQSEEWTRVLSAPPFGVVPKHYQSNMADLCNITKSSLKCIELHPKWFSLVS